VSVKIRLMRLGKIRTPHYRVVVSNSRSARDSKAIEEIGRYSPAVEPSLIQINSDRVQYWLGVGAQPSEAVTALLKVTGDWQKFRGEAGSEGTLRVAPPRADKKVAYEAAVKAAANEPADGATTMKKRAQEKLAAKSAPAEAPVTEEAPKVEAVAETEVEAPAEAVTEAPVEVSAEAPTETPAE
jgi:small subunit ribosomal protein S16